MPLQCPEHCFGNDHVSCVSNQRFTLFDLFGVYRSAILVTSRYMYRIVQVKVPTSKESAGV